jgi:DNA repair protein RadC
MYVCELTRRTYKGTTEKVITSPDDAFQMFQKRFQHGEAREIFVAILLTARNTVLGIETIAVGSLNASIVHPREVFRPAIEQAAASLILAHNHPSGIPEPSDDDLAITRRLVQVGDLVGIPIVDHLIIAGGTFVSFKQQGHIS